MELSAGESMRIIKIPVEGSKTTTSLSASPVNPSLNPEVQ
jgi:hypothetical protein